MHDKQHTPINSLLLNCCPSLLALARIAVLVMLLTGLSGCALLDLRTDVQKQEDHGAVALQVSGCSQGVRSYAMALALSGGVVSCQEVPTDGLVAFLLPKGKTYNVAGFSDRNSNRRFDPGEPSGWLPGQTPRVLSDASAIGAPQPLALSTSGTGVPDGLKIPAGNSPDPGAISVNLGQVTTLGDPRFSVANGTLGFWQPYEFLTKLGWGVYFLQPYDAKKIPVIFVYGIDGSPQDWRSVIASLDRTRFQPWIFHYPSGMRLAKSANGLSHAMQVLRAKYGFPKAYVVAHSMGGLVARGAVKQAIRESGTNFIPTFLTLCTPWAGDAAADSGVKHLRYPVPAWIDMQPGSMYLKGLFATGLPSGTRHFLIFDFQTKTAPWLKPDNDSVVQVASELFPPAQAAAVAMFGFPYAHVETLGKADVHAKVNEFLSR